MNTHLYHQICKYLQQLIKGTKWEGHLYAVGGCCRDEVMGNEIKDIDLAVDLPLGGVEFAGWLHKRQKTVDRPIVFEKYSTAMFSLREFANEQIEIVQTRSNKYTRDILSSPEKAFGSINEDAQRRDLTINCLYRNISTGELIDYTGKALIDIANKTLRTPLNPDITFEDDPIRILRCIRFSCNYGWKLDQATLESMKRNSSKLENATKERIRTEMLRIICCDEPLKALRMLRSIGAMKSVMWEVCKLFSAKSNGSTLWTQTLKVIELLPNEPILRMSALLHEIGKTATKVINENGECLFPEYSAQSIRIAGKLLRRQKCDQQLAAEVKFICLNHSVFYINGIVAKNIKDKRLRRLLIDCQSRQRYERLITFIKADATAHGFYHDIEQFIVRLDQIATTEQILSDAQDTKPLKIKASKNNSRRRHHGGQRRRAKKVV